MKALTAQIGSLLGCLACLYGLLWAVSIAIFPPAMSDASLDTSQASHTLYMTEPRYIYLNRAPLELPGAKVILVGASNTVVGFRQHDLAPLIRNARVDNLAIGGANVTEMAQVVDLALHTENASSRRQTTFVLGIWYGMFGSNQDWWFSPDRHGGDTDIDIERYRYGFCWRTGQGPLSLVSPQYIGAAALAIHPYLVAEKLVRDTTTFIDVRLLGKAAMRTEQQRNEASVDEPGRSRAISYWENRLGPSGSIPPEQFDALQQLIGALVSTGANVVLVDLPLPKWHAERSPYLASYYQQLMPIVDAFQGLPRFRFMRLKGLSDDADFSDEVHPKPKISAEWSRQLANVLNQTASEEVSRDAELAAATSAGPII